MGSTETTHRRAGRRARGAALVLACLTGASAVLFLLGGGGPAGASSTIGTTLTDSGSDSAADGNGNINITVGDTVLFRRPDGFIFTVTLTPPGGGSKVQLPPGNKAGTSGRAYLFKTGGSYGFKWTAGDTTRTYSGAVVVDDPSTNPPPPPPTSDTPTQHPTSSQPGSVIATTPGSGTSTSPVGTGSAVGSATATTTGSPTASGAVTTPPAGSGGITFPSSANTTIPVNGFAGPGADPGSSALTSLLPTTVNTTGDASTVSVQGGSTVPVTAEPSTISLTSHHTTRPTVLAIISIAALAIVLAVYARRRLASRPLH
ncbi:hypothetical protein [Jatrophihabitans sp.]|uniref:hypothetical protein n=1 Tax=Jatrophihabitans sp. TaxID=1932789 RepID=UPI0030C6AD87|nr:hypothetical protein [Jatrophihabitans sp.]